MYAFIGRRHVPWINDGDRIVIDQRRYLRAALITQSTIARLLCRTYLN